MIRLLVASANPGKVREIESLLSGLPGWAVEAPPPDVPAPPETGATFLENARLKAEHYSRNAEGWAVADDSGLVVDALNGRPGVYSARYAASDRERNARLLKELEDVPEIDRTARFVCALALARDGVVVWTVEERVEGRIASSPSGAHGFGFDPVFLASELDRTMAELSPDEKNRISHRGKALRRLRQHLAAMGD